MRDLPLAYFLTFHTYGTWLPGHNGGSVDDEHNRVGDPVRPGSADLEKSVERKMSADALRLSDSQRRIVLQAILRTAEHRQWRVHAVHVRTTHVHVVITSDKTPERTMNDFKIWATRRLYEAKEVGDDVGVWSRHGSTPYLWTDEQVARAVRDTLHEQGSISPGTAYPESAY